MRRFKYFCVTSAFVFGFCSLQAIGQQLPALSISPVPSTLTVGESFVVDVDIANVTDLYGWQLDLNFTPGIVAAGTANEGAFLATGGSTFFVAGTNNNTAGTVANNANTLLTAVPGVSGAGILEVFDFTATHSGGAAFSLQNVTLLNSGLNPISATMTGASVTVKGSTPVPEPSSVMMLAFGLLCLAKPLVGRLRWLLKRSLLPAKHTGDQVQMAIGAS